MNGPTQYRNGLTPRLRECTPEGRPYKGREGDYFPSNSLVAAANAAIVLGMPLLLTGEPGCGKTDFAEAAATELGWPFHPCHVRSDSRARDLLYSYDALRRFGDAQHGSEREREHARDPRRYIRLEGLGMGLTSPERSVVLIDEIDKAPRDLPNDLLRELDRSRGDFEVPELNDVVLAGLDTDYKSAGVKPPRFEPDGFEARLLVHTMKRPDKDIRPLVIITSNIERQLPEPFLRRCLFFHIEFPGKTDLVKIVQGRFPDQPELLVTQAIDLVLTLRKHYSLTKKPTTSELLQWVEVLGGMYDPGHVQQTLGIAASKIDRDKYVPLAGQAKPLDWSLIPGLACLLKLDEDLQRVLPKRTA